MLLSRLEAILNRNLDGSRKARTAARELEGRSLGLVVTATPVTIYFKVADGRIGLASSHAGTTDALIEGTPIALLALAGGRAEQGMRSGTVRIEGDAEVAQSFRTLLEATQPEFEEELARVIGDVAAHRLAGLARGLFGWGRRTADSLALNAAEFLQEEGRDVPTRVEVEEFVADVDTLRDDVDRLAARVDRLAAKSAGASGATAAPARGTPRRR
jgi:ubiquinone biosynthesis protein UbiJ